MNILMVGNHFSDSHHNPNVWQDLASHLIKSGHRIITVSRKRNKVLRLLDIIFSIIQKRRQYQVAEVDVFSGQAFYVAYLSVILLSILRKPTVLTLHGGNLPKFASQHPKLVNKLLVTANKVISPSDYLARSLKNHNKEISIIPNAIDVDSYPYIKRNSPAPRLIWLRAFHKIYNPKMAVYALDLIKTLNPDAHLLMIGPDKGDGSLQETIQLIMKLRLEDAIDIIGQVEKKSISEWLNKADLFLNTSNFDNAPISMIESMACGLPIISTNVGGIPWLIEDQVDGLLVPPNDPEQMARAVNRILTEPNLAVTLAEQAHNKAEKLDWTVILPQWENLFTEVYNRSYVQFG